MTIRTVLATAVSLVLVSGAAAQQPAPPAPQQPDFSKAEVKVTDLGKKTFMLEGVGGNITVAAGDDAVIMIDAQFAPMHDKIKAAVEAATKLPIRYVVNTHFHGDHTGGNAGFANDGAVITAQANVAKRLSEGTTNGLTGAKTPPVTGAGLPSNTYTDELTLKIAGRTAAQACRQRPHRRRHLRLLDRGQCAVDRRHLLDRPLSQHRLCQWRQHQGDDRGLRSLP